MARTSDSISECVNHLKQGHLVSFPTETVYGLGANALNEEAVLSIFAAKKRPLNDPVIVHVSDIDQALSLIDLQDAELLSLYRRLAQAFWPGPLTLVTPKGPSLPMCLTAQTGWIGIRSPNHPLALQLITESGLPIAAPSANIFAHVSPTTSDHVCTDFLNSDYEILVLDGGPCSFGIESTVVKLSRTEAGLTLTIMRRGGVSEQQLQAQFPDVIIEAIAKNSTVKETEATVAPGQAVKHYSPADKDTFLLSEDQTAGLDTFAQGDVIIIDFNGQQIRTPNSAYMDLSEDGDIEEAAKNLYMALRWTETKQGQCVLLPDLSKFPENEHTDAISDRLFRAASGRNAYMKDGRLWTT